jgi:hypothetical protein
VERPVSDNNRRLPHKAVRKRVLVCIAHLSDTCLYSIFTRADLVADDSQTPRKISEQFAARYIERATRAWFVLIVAALLVTLFSLRAAKLSQLFAVVFFAGLLLAFTFLNVRKTVQRAWSTDQISGLYRGFILVYFSAIGANLITMLVFWRTYFNGSDGVTAGVIPIYAAAIAWGAFLVAYRNRIRRPLARALNDLYISKYGQPIAGSESEFDLRLFPARRWHPLSVVSMAAIIGGFVVGGQIGSVLLLLGMVTFLIRGVWLLVALGMRRRQAIAGVLKVGRIRNGAIPFSFQLDLQVSGPNTVTAEIVLVRALPGAYERECEQFGSFAAEMPLDVHAQPVTLPVFLPQLPITVSDHQWLRYVVRVKVEAPSGQWATKEPIGLTSVAVLVDADATPATA